MRINLPASILLVVVCWLLCATAGKGQNITAQKVAICLNDESLETAINKIEGQSHFHFFYRKEDVNRLTHLNLPQNTRTIEQTLDTLLQNTALVYKQIDDNILLERKDSRTAGEIQGRVVNSFDKNPVANASVFLSNATIGSTTAANGTFILRGIKPGKYVLAVSVVGFEPCQLAISADNGDELLPDVELSPKTTVLKEVIIRAAPDPDRERNYGWFKDEFLGTSAFAANCKIINPQALNLYYDKAAGVLTASSPDFLLIENQALGYNLKYVLAGFMKINGDKNTLKVQFSGTAFFEEMKGTPVQQKRWLKKRQEVYEGSDMHFLRSALNNSLDAEGFKVLRVTKSNGVKYSAVLEQTPLAQADFIKLTNQKGLYALLSNNSWLYISYNKKHRFAAGRLDKAGDPLLKQSTVIKFEAPFVLFDKNGSIIDPDCVTFTGAWEKNRVAELLPVDYDPAQTAGVDFSYQPAP